LHCEFECASTWLSVCTRTLSVCTRTLRATVHFCACVRTDYSNPLNCARDSSQQRALHLQPQVLPRPNPYTQVSPLSSARPHLPRSSRAEVTTQVFTTATAREQHLYKRLYRLLTIEIVPCKTEVFEQVHPLACSGVGVSVVPSGRLAEVREVKPVCGD
jgi:hypothetical protein